MKELVLVTLVGAVALCDMCAEDSAIGDTEANPLVVKHDLNGNGKIDVNERKPYLQELALQRRAEAAAFASERPVVSPQERQFLRLPRLTPDLIRQYDTNQNGRLEMSEHLQMQHAAAEAARAELQRFDANGDGELDQDELTAARESRRLISHTPGDGTNRAPAHAGSPTDGVNDASSAHRGRAGHSTVAPVSTNVPGQ